MWSEAANHYKIGSGDVGARLKSHRTALPDIALVAAVQHPSYEAIESRVHAYFRDERIGESECFTPSSRLKDWVARFSASPGVVNAPEKMGESFSLPHIWPWIDNAAPLDDEGQTSLPISVPYVPPSPQEPHGDGQTSAVSEDWYTPAPYIAAVKEVFGGRIDLDPCSCAEAQVTVGAEGIFTAEVDGLRQRWSGKLYINPPWGKTGHAKKAFVRRAIREYESGGIDAAILALNSNATTSRWFAPLFNYSICFPDHRVPHYGPGGVGGAPNSGTVFVYLGENIDEFINVFSRFGAVVTAAAAGAASLNLRDDYEDEEAA